MSNSKQNNLNYRVSGNGYPVVFLHGFLESSSMWDYLEFSSEFKKIVIDLPGHGSSKLVCDDSVSMASIASEVQKLLNDLGIRAYHLVGHSMGGYVGLELKKLDVKCQKLMLLNSNFWADSELKKRDRFRVSKIVETNKEHFIYEAIPNLFLNPEKNDMSVRVLIKEALLMKSSSIAYVSLAMARRLDNSEFVKDNSEDVLVVQGRGDAIVDCERMERFAFENNISLSIIENCGHMAHVEKGERVVQEIQSLLS